MGSPRILIIGGVAGGASCATRARRLSESADIIMVERGPHVSFANCGLPYRIGGEIADREHLFVTTPEALRERFAIDVRTLTEAVSIDAAARTVRLRNLRDGSEYDESYDELVLSPGAAPIRPPLPGIDLPGHFTLRNVPDSDRIVTWLEQPGVKHAVVIGAGFIGLEMVEQFRHRGLDVTLIELQPQVMPPLDRDMAGYVEQELAQHGVRVLLGDKVTAFEPSPDAKASIVVTANGERIAADIVIVGVGVRAETALASSAGAEIGALGGIRVDEFLQTTIPHVWAIGDAIEVRDPLTQAWTRVPLAGPANRQGRTVADNILRTRRPYRGTWGTAIVRAFSMQAGCTGAGEKTLRRNGTPHRCTIVHRAHHAGYYPGAEMIHFKLLWSPEDGRILGAQAVGRQGVDKRLDVIATALAGGLTIDDVAELELSYAPPVGSAKDIINIAGMAAQNERDGLVESVSADDVPALLEAGSHVVLDVRAAGERLHRQIAGSLHIPLDELRSRLGELPRDKAIIAHCHTGQRSYLACRIMRQNGIRCVNLSGSMLTWSAIPRTM